MNFDLSDAGAGRAGKVDQQSRVSSLAPTLPYHSRVYGRCKVLALLDLYTSITTRSDTELQLVAYDCYLLSLSLCSISFTLPINVVHVKQSFMSDIICV